MSVPETINHILIEERKFPRFLKGGKNSISSDRHPGCPQVKREHENMKESTQRERRKEGEMREEAPRRGWEWSLISLKGIQFAL